MNKPSSTKRSHRAVVLGRVIAIIAIVGSVVIWRANRPVPISRPYEPGSLKALTDEELYRYMGNGAHVSDVIEQADVIPANFWDLKPKDAAFAFADANRTREHHGDYRLQYKEPIPTNGPPSSGSLAYSWLGGGWYRDRESTHSYWITFQENRGQLIHWKATRVLHWPQARGIHDVRQIPLEGSAARHLAQTIWWLNQLESPQRVPLRYRLLELAGWYHGVGVCGSNSADGSGFSELTLVPTQETPVLLLRGSGCYGNISGDWLYDLGEYQQLGMADYLIREALVNRLGTKWTTAVPPAIETWKNACDDRVFLNASYTSMLEENASHVIGTYLQDTNQVPFILVCNAVGAAGDYGLTNLLPIIKQVHNLAPEIGKVEVSDYGTEMPTPVQLVTKSVLSTLTQFELQNDLSNLVQVACSTNALSGWAIQRLQDIDPDRYKTALEWWINSTDSGKRLSALKLMNEIDSAQAHRLAADLIKSSTNLPPMEVLGMIQEDQALWDQLGCTDRLLKPLAKAENEKNEKQVRLYQLLGILVPNENPRRFADDRIDTTLMERLHDNPLDSWDRATIARALIARGHTNVFDEVMGWLNNTNQFSSALPVALEFAGKLDPPRSHELVPILKTLLESTRTDMINEASRAAWTLDLREVRPQLAAIATSSPDDGEGATSDELPSHFRLDRPRYHWPRHVLTMWDEPDPVTKAKLVIAHSWQVWWYLPDTLSRARIELSALAATCSPEQKADIHHFYRSMTIRHPRSSCERKDIGPYIDALHGMMDELFGVKDQP
jgi:hypothetical protein